MRRKKQAEIDNYIKELKKLNNAYLSAAAQLEALREESGKDGEEELRLLTELIELGTMIAERTEGSEREHWLRQIEQRQAELPPKRPSEQKVQPIQDAFPTGLKGINGEKPFLFGKKRQALRPEGIEALAFEFLNYAPDLYPGDPNPKIPLIRYQQMFGNTALAVGLYENEGGFGGICFGFSAAAMFIALQIHDLCANDFQPGAKRPYDLGTTSFNRKIGMSLLEYIEALYISQFCYLIVSEYNRILTAPQFLDNLWEIVRHYQETGESPVTLDVFWWDEKGKGHGHAITPYKAEMLDEEIGVIYTYDCNWSLVPTPVYLRRDSQGHFAHWMADIRHIGDPDEMVSGDRGAEITYSKSETIYQAWEERGKLTDEPVSIRVACDCTVLDSQGSVVLRVKDGATEVYRKNCFPVNHFSFAAQKDHLVWIPAGAYRVVNNSSSKMDMNVSLTQKDQFASVSTNAGSVEINVSDDIALNSVAISESNKNYRIRLSSTLPNTHREVIMEGVTDADGLTLSQYQGTVYASRLDNAELTLDGAAATENEVVIGQPDLDCNEETDSDENLLIHFQESADEP